MAMITCSDIKSPSTIIPSHQSMSSRIRIVPLTNIFKDVQWMLIPPGLLIRHLRIIYLLCLKILLQQQGEGYYVRSLLTNIDTYQKKDGTPHMVFVF